MCLGQAGGGGPASRPDGGRQGFPRPTGLKPSRSPPSTSTRAPAGCPCLVLRGRPREGNPPERARLTLHVTRLPRDRPQEAGDECRHTLVNASHQGSQERGGSTGKGILESRLGQARAGARGSASARNLPSRAGWARPAVSGRGQVSTLSSEVPLAPGSAPQGTPPSPEPPARYTGDRTARQQPICRQEVPKPRSRERGPSHHSCSAVFGEWVGRAAQGQDHSHQENHADH